MSPGSAGRATRAGLPRCLRPRRARLLVRVALAGLALVAGCGTTNQTAVATGGSFEFVAPGGQTRIFDDPPDSRGSVRGLAGDSLLEPGQTIGLSDFPGQVVVLNIWGAWCGPCREEMPDLQYVHHQMQSAGVTLLGIDVATTPTPPGTSWSTAVSPTRRSTTTPVGR